MSRPPTPGGPTIASANGKGKLKLLTRDDLDGRTKAAQLFDQTFSEIARDLGGEENISAIERHLIEAFSGVARDVTPTLREYVENITSEEDVDA
jgi:hypothetical protein